MVAASVEQTVFACASALAETLIPRGFAFAETRCVCRFRLVGAAASYARCGSTWSITVCVAAAVRRVMNGDPMPIHNVTAAMVARIHFSRTEASGSVLFFATVISPKKTRWYDHSK